MQHRPEATEQRAHREGRGATETTDTPNEDEPGFLAKGLEHCFACYRLIRPGQTYYLTLEHEVLCADCALDERVIHVREDLAVEVKRDRLLIQRGRLRWRYSRARFGTW